MYPAGAALPAWTASARPPTGLPWAQSASGNMVGVLFGAPFQAAPRTDDKANKILFISQAPRNGQTLKITGTRLSDGMTATASQTADTSPGEIYPTVVDMPAPGCWQLALQWGPNTATFDIYYA